jgi:hypothetical protein
VRATTRQWEHDAEHALLQPSKSTREKGRAPEWLGNVET